MTKKQDHEKNLIHLSSVRFILVETSHPGNVGSVARAMKTMGMKHLVLVKPKCVDVLKHPEAIALASGATDILDSAQVVPDLKTALDGIQFSVAMTAREREFSPPYRSVRDVAEKVNALSFQQHKVALVFGNERVGLENQDVMMCQAITSIETNSFYSSLNLAQAVQIMAYELRMASLNKYDLRLSMGNDNHKMASVDAIEGLLTHLESALIEIAYLNPQNPKKLMTRLRALFARAQLYEEEVHLLRGIAKHMILSSREKHFISADKSKILSSKL